MATMTTCGPSLHYLPARASLSSRLLPPHRRPFNLAVPWKRCPPSSSLRASSEDAVSDSTQVAVARAGTRTFSVPLTLEESVEQALLACKQAGKGGLRRLQLEVLLPLIGATDLDDWPGGIQQQFKAAIPIVFALLKGLTGVTNPSQDVTVKEYILDEGDAVGVWETEKVLLVLFPNADCLEKVEELASSKDRMVLFVNPQWQAGQVISDFGFGAQKRAREGFVESFETVYSLKQLRILGEDVRLLKCYPGNWQVFVMDRGGGSECVAIQEEKPAYSRLQAILRARKGSKAGQGWFGRLLEELRFNQDSLNN